MTTLNQWIEIKETVDKLTRLISEAEGGMSIVITINDNEGECKIYSDHICNEISITCATAIFTQGYRDTNDLLLDIQDRVNKEVNEEIYMHIKTQRN